MTFKFTNSEEDDQIKQLYRSGEWSFRQLAERFNLSKGTIINICKQYPYGSYKQAYGKLQEQSATRLEKVINDTEVAAQKAFERGAYAAYGNHMQRWIDLLDEATSEDTSYESLKLKRLDYEQRAWAAFAEREYEKFGYFAESWDVLTDIIGDSTKNPWGEIPVKVSARAKSKHLRFTILDNNK